MKRLAAAFCALSLFAAAPAFAGGTGCTGLTEKPSSTSTASTTSTYKGS